MKVPLLCLLALGAGFGFRTPQNPSMQDVKIRDVPVAGSVHMLLGRGGNIGVSAGPDGLLIVDDQFAPLAPKIKKALAEIADGPLKFVLNTHWHGDHTGGNAIFGRTGTILAQENVRKRLSTRQETSFGVTEASPPAALPVITFPDRVTLHFNGEEIRVIHLPAGHTDGDSVVWFVGSNVVHMGDDFFKDSFPFVDLASGGSVEGLERNVRKVIAELPADVKIIPGHGSLGTLDDLKNFHAMLAETLRIVGRKKQKGETLEAIQAEGLPAKWDSWGRGFIKTDRWIETIFQSLDG